MDWSTPVNEDCLKLTTYFGERQRSLFGGAVDCGADYRGHQLEQPLKPVQGTNVNLT